MKESNHKEEFTELLDKYKGLLYKIARSYTSSPDDCQDLVQEITIALWRSYNRYDHQHSYSTWIYRIALNVSISHLRKEYRRIQPTAPLTEELLLFPSEEPTTHPDIELLYQLIGALNQLDKAIMLLYLDEKSHREMAEILGLSETNIATKISRIKVKWRQQLITQNS